MKIIYQGEGGEKDEAKGERRRVKKKKRDKGREKETDKREGEGTRHSEYLAYTAKIKVENSLQKLL